MSRLNWPLLLLVAFTALPLLAAEEPAEKKKPKDDAATSELEATLVAKEDTYTLAMDQQGEKFRETIQNPRNRDVPPPPKVDLMLELKNPTDKPITIVVGADNGALELDLQGPGAVEIKPLIIMTREFRLGEPVTIAAGKTYEMPIKQLKYGMRGISTYAYWTEPGDYTLSATFRWPEPADGVAGSLPKRWKAMSKPVKITVKAE